MSGWAHTHPLIAGRGKKLIARVLERRGLRVRQAKALASGIVLLKYERNV